MFSVIIPENKSLKKTVHNQKRYIMRERRITTLIIFLITISLIALGLTLGQAIAIPEYYKDMIIGA